MPAGVDALAFCSDTAIELAGLAKERVLPRIPSRTLARSLRLVARPAETEGGASIALFIPHYWAKYVHDGRGVVRPVNKKRLLFFKPETYNPRTDYGTNYPVREADRRSLDPDDYIITQELSKLEFAFFADSVKPVTPTPFFEQGLGGLPSEASLRVPQRFSQLVQANTINEKATVVLSL